jgi:hypothetical protein
MKVYGYCDHGDDLIELKEVSFQSSIEELDILIKFLQDVKEQHRNVMGETDMCHTHFRDWNKEWQIGSTDIIIVTMLKSE